MNYIMKALYPFLALSTFLFNLSLCNAQSVKVSLNTFRYEFMPKVVLPANYKTYKIDAYSAATDGIPLNSRYIYIAEEYIKGLKNISVPYVKNGIMIGGFVIGGKDKSSEKTEEIPANLQVSIVFNNIEMIDKKEFVNKTTNLQTNQQESYLTYKLSFKFSYVIKVKDVEKNQYILDTLIDTPKNTLFPCDYRFDAFGNKIVFPGYANKPDLDVDYNKNGKDLYSNSKAVLAQTCMNETKAILKTLYSYYWDNRSITIYRVKTKDPLFDICDTISDLVNNICDSISFHSKNEKHLNWHTADIKLKAKKITTSWENFISNEVYVNAFKNPNDKVEFIDRMKRNLILGYLFLDEFDKALKFYYEIEPHMRVSTYDNMNDENLKSIVSILRREKLLYEKHKSVYNFN